MWENIVFNFEILNMVLQTAILFQDQLRCSCAKYLSQLTEKQAQLMRKKLPQKRPINGVEHIILVASGKGGVGKSTTAGKLLCYNSC